MKQIRSVAGVMAAVLMTALLPGCTGIFGSGPKEAEKSKTPSTLFEAARYGDFARVKFLVQQGADVTAPDKHGRSPLHFAVMSGKLEIVEFLVERGAGINLQDDKGRTPLHIAAQLKNAEIERYLDAHGADRTLVDIYGRKPGDRTKISRKEMNARKRQERMERKHKSAKGGRKIKFR